MEWSDEQVSLVNDRLVLIKSLIEAKEYFRGSDKTKSLPNREWTHPYKDYAALRVYLALTCFDILGQPTEWLDFNSWLNSKRKRNERDFIIKDNLNSDYSKFISDVHQEYNKIYGVKNSFNRFITEILSDTNREKLLTSIRTSVEVTPRILSDTGTTLATTKWKEISDERKIRFLFKIRNSFTHKGISIESPGGGIFDIEKAERHPHNGKLTWSFNQIHRENINGEVIYFHVQRWPFLLVDIIEDTINKNENTKANIE